MKKHSFSLSLKIWIAVTASILITVLFSYFISDYLYEELYVENIKESLLQEGIRLSADYNGGPLNDELRDKIEWYNRMADSEVFVVSNPKELNACLPYEVDHETLIGPEEREQLLKGEPVQKRGYEERFDRSIISVIIPLLDENRLEGIIYLYYPLAKISELTKSFSYLWIIGGAMFVVISIFIGTLLVRRLTSPLQALKDAADQLSKGDYSTRVPAVTNDEIGQLAHAFNHMAESIQQEDERKRDFIANVSHELRTPISYIKGYCEALLTGIVKDKEEKRKYLSLVHRESERMANIVSDLLVLSKLEAKQLELEKVPLPLAQLVEDALEKYHLPMKEKGLELIIDMDPEIIVNGDATKIEEVIQNIMDNAINYTNKGSITVKLGKHKDGCSLLFKDTGIGIPKEDLGRITERFFRVNKARSRSDGGTGLGLAITKNIVQLHGGKLLIRSELGKGTEVEVILPAIEFEEN